MSILSVKNLEKKFGDLTVLKDISFDINDGEIISIIGSSGSGKSTLLRCMNQLETITSGTITIDGKTLVETKNGTPVYAGKDVLKEILMETGFVFQNFNLFPHYSVLRNVMDAPVAVQKRDKEEVRKVAMELLEKMGLADKADAYPCQLSGGQCQRVALARSLVTRPRLLLLDEPLSALDARIRKHLREQIRQHLANPSDPCTSLEQVAGRLHRSARTLRRHLQELNTSFQQLLDEVRFDRARHLLTQTELPIYLIAEQLGYSETASFRHAFQRWSGQTPSLYRR